MRLVEQAAGAVLLIFALAVIYLALQLRYYTSIGPGPGFFPVWLGILLAALSLMMIVHATIVTPTASEDSFLPSRAGILRVGAVVLSLAATIALMDRLGFTITMFFILLFLIVSLGRHKPLTCLLIALAGSVGAYHIFVHWLNVPLPHGSFGI